ncbi:hypothetical protein V1283_002745 [Bradyrhizobium sp. AZCC 2262]
MRGVLSLTTFAIGVLCFVAFLIKVRPASVTPAPSSSEQVNRNCSIFRSDERCL